jgi:hypothetical protein
MNKIWGKTKAGTSNHGQGRIKTILILQIAVQWIVPISKTINLTPIFSPMFGGAAAPPHLDRG